MAEIEVGKQCSVTSCKQLDFLPFLCSDCTAIFCLEHRSTTSHNCKGRAQKTKPDCQSSIKTSVPSKCSLDGCDVQELLLVECEFCKGVFCLRHRHQVDHCCLKLTTFKSSSSSRPQATTERKAKIGHGGAKCDSRAAKVALMKMKLRAAGQDSTPQAERVYFSVILPAELQENSQPMFFSKYWTVGRIIDHISKMCKLKNDNNQQFSKKLRLFAGVSRKPLILGNTLEREMIDNPETLSNGSQLVLEYVVGS